MELSILQITNSKPSLNQTSHQFISGIGCYETMVDDIIVYFSQCDFTNGEDLREKNMVDFYLERGRIRSRLKMSMEMMSDKPMFEYLIKESINS